MPNFTRASRRGSKNILNTFCVFRFSLDRKHAQIKHFKSMKKLFPNCTLWNWLTNGLSWTEPLGGMILTPSTSSALSPPDLLADLRAALPQDGSHRLKAQGGTRVHSSGHRSEECLCQFYLQIKILRPPLPQLKKTKTNASQGDETC